MKKAILIYPNPKSSVVQYPTGLFKIASYCASEYEIIVLDERIEVDIIKKINELLDKHNILCIGFSVMTGQPIKYALNLSKEFHGKTKIVWGGIHSTISPKEVISNRYIDFVVIGDGESAFLNLLNYLDSGHVDEELFLSTENKNYRPNFYDISKNDYIDFQRFKINNKYFSKRDGFLKAFPIETSRGCPHNCSFCHNSILKRPYKNIKNECLFSLIEFLDSNYKIDGLIFQEDNFFLKRKRIVQILEFMSSKQNISWKANSRIDYFEKLLNDMKFMDLLVNSGCKVLQFGVESGSQRIVDMINKKINLKEVLKTNRKLSHFPIQIRYNFIVGFPGEKSEEIDKTFEFINLLRKDNFNAEPPLVSIYTPYPGTQMFEKAIKFGFDAPKNLESWSEVNWRKAVRNHWLSSEKIFDIENKSKEFAQNSHYTPYK